MTHERSPKPKQANPGRPRSEHPLWNATAQPIRQAVTVPPLAVLVKLHRAYIRALAVRYRSGTGRHGQ